MAGFAPNLPDAVILLVPTPGGGVGHLDEELSGGRREVRRLVPLVGRGERPHAALDRIEDAVGQPMHGAQQLSVDVELALAPGPVADPNGCRPAPALQVGQLPFGQVPLAADPEHDLEVTGLLE